VELKHNQLEKFKILGMTKPGSTLANVMNTPSSDLNTLKKNNVCVIWVGTNDVGRNETSVGVRALNDFVNSLHHTKVIVLNVPHRHDLTPNSCVNDEIMVFNRKVGKLCKVYKNLSVLPVDIDRIYILGMGCI
jgi:hypothetical protein